MPLDPNTKKVVIDHAGAAIATTLLSAVRLTTPEHKLHDTLDEFFEGVFNEFEDQLVRLGMDREEAAKIATAASEYGATWLEYLEPPRPDEDGN